jgi:hypothetical protein
MLFFIEFRYRTSFVIAIGVGGHLIASLIVITLRDCVSLGFNEEFFDFKDFGPSYMVNAILGYGIYFLIKSREYWKVLVFFLPVFLSLLFSLGFYSFSGHFISLLIGLMVALVYRSHYLISR